ncbi:hypothetical protein [Marinomonas transparens]|uniref:Uncharacterized protein n=1 Tax=Marinomonas transparens TaxID=2795388 RepID=A0A934MYV1_9GAMM|nr:hypothetical protein [Marinomonas transparens]MBJ7536860.1 hypothetical protein [Marinomonas transparens]
MKIKLTLALVALLSSGIASADVGISKVERVGIDSVGQLHIDLKDDVVQTGCSQITRLVVPASHSQLDRWFTLAKVARIHGLPVGYKSSGCVEGNWGAILDDSWFQIEFPESSDS